MTEASRRFERLERNLGRAAEHARVQMAQHLAGLGASATSPTLASRRRPQDTRLQRQQRGGLVPLTGITRLRSVFDPKPLVQAKPLVETKPLAAGPEAQGGDGFTAAQVESAVQVYREAFAAELLRLEREG